MTADDKRRHRRLLETATPEQLSQIRALTPKSVPTRDYRKFTYALARLVHGKSINAYNERMLRTHGSANLRRILDIRDHTGGHAA